MPDYKRLASYFQRWGSIDIVKKARTVNVKIDGKITKQIAGFYRYPRVKIEILSEDLMKLLTNDIGGSSSYHKGTNTHQWYCQGNEAATFCKNIHPYLTGKQKDYATFIIDFVQNAAPTPTKTADERATYELWLERIKSGKEAYHPFNPVEIL